MDDSIDLNALYGTPELTTEARRLNEMEIRELEELILDGELVGSVEFGLEALNSNNVPLTLSASRLIDVAMRSRGLSLEDVTTSTDSTNQVEGQNKAAENKLNDKLKVIKNKLLEIWEKIKKAFIENSKRIQQWFGVLFNKAKRARAGVDSLSGKLNALSDETQPLSRTFESSGIATLGIDARATNEQMLKERISEYIQISNELISGSAGKAIDEIVNKIDDSIRNISSALSTDEINSPEELMTSPKVKSANLDTINLVKKLDNAVKSKLKAKQVTEDQPDNGYETSQLLGGKQYSIILPKISNDKEAVLNFWELADKIKGDVSAFKKQDTIDDISVRSKWETATKDTMLEICELLKTLLDGIITKEESTKAMMKSSDDIIKELDALVKSDRIKHPEVKKYVRQISSGALKLHKNVVSINSVWMGYCIETANASIAFMVKSLEQY